VLCILYVNAAGLCLGFAGVLVERTLSATATRRWLWCVVIAISIVLPGYYRFHHPWAVGVLGQEAHSGSMIALDQSFWVGVESYNNAIGWLSLLASALILCAGLATALRVALAIAASRRRRGNRASGDVISGVRVVVTDSIGPATVGFWRSRVLIPEWVLAMPPTQRQYVIRHEEEHRSAQDARLLFVASLVLILAPWNLAVWWQLRRLYLAVEIDCDNRVVKRLGDPNAYGELLLTVAQASSRGLRLQPALLGGIGSLERRLTALIDPAPLRQAQRLLLPVLALGLLIIVLITPHPVLRRAAHAHSMQSAAATATQPAVPR
jgi:bla regulator protein blaR1